MGKQKFTLAKLTDFVVEGKKRGYASGKEASSTSRMPGFKRFEFSRGLWKYVDEYTGMYAFFGTETVSFNQVPVWGMSYNGGVTEEFIGDEKFSEEIYAFLIQNLAQVSLKHPFRGPGLVEGDDFRYNNVAYGDLTGFNGRERIIAKTQFPLQKQVHEVNYHGRLIVPRDYGLIIAKNG